MSNEEQDMAISYYIEEIEEDCKNEFIIDEIMNKFNNHNDDVLVIPHIINYHENYTVKELLLICDYYGFSKEMKNNKYNKEKIINCLVLFEADPNNSVIVFKRQNMWFYMNELKNDKFMKKFIVW